MNIKLISLICFITTFLFAKSSFGVEVSWDASISPNVSGYKIFYGINSKEYTTVLDVGNVTNYIINDTNFISKTPYYFSVKTYDSIGDESDFSDEYTWTNIPLSITYVGIKLDYGTNIFSLSSQRIMVMSFTNQSGNFYNQSLVITNNPFTGIRPIDTNKYVYIGTIIHYGTNIFSLNSLRTGILTFTNPPTYYYRSSLVLTNNPF